jgi:hypothetical protein
MCLQKVISKKTVTDENSRIRIHIRNKISWIRNTGIRYESRRAARFFVANPHRIVAFDIWNKNHISIYDPDFYLFLSELITTEPDRFDKSLGGRWCFFFSWRTNTILIYLIFRNLVDPERYVVYGIRQSDA